MKFDFVDTERVVERTRSLKGHLRGDPYEEYTYEATIESTGETASSALTNAKCRLTVLQETESGELEELWLFPVLPLQFEIRLRETGTLLQTFQRISTRLEPYSHRARVAAKSHGRDPVDALRALREQEVVLHLEVERKADGEFEPIVWGTSTKVRTESVAEIDRPCESETIDKSLQARLLSRRDEFVGSAGD